MFSIGNVNPDRNMNGMKTKNCAVIIACCCVFEIVETNNPSSSVVRTNNPLSPNSSATLPRRGTSRFTTMFSAAQLELIESLPFSAVPLRGTLPYYER